MNLPAWTWCIATYNRHDVLERACALALSQSVPPAEVVVTDASADWETGRARLARLIDRVETAGGGRPRLSYEKAAMPSLPAQRNQSIERSNSEVLFLFDDDTLMFPDTAARLLEVYAKDTDHVVQAVTARHVPDSPPMPDKAGDPDADALARSPAGEGAEGAAMMRVRNPLAAAVRRLLRADDIFVPYDPEPRVHAVPGALEGMGLLSWPMAAGFHLTVRRSAVLREPFEGRLKGYSPGEDSDLTYRLTRHGPILHQLEARIHHIEAPGERFGMFERTALGALNPLLLHRVHSSDRAYSERLSRNLLWRRLFIELVKDLQNLDFGLSRARGILFGLRHLREIMSARDDELDALFDRFQSP